MYDGPLDFTSIVGGAARRVEAATGVLVSVEAQRVLIDRAVEHEDDVRKALSREHLDVADLVDAAEKQLLLAVDESANRIRKNYSKGKRVVDDQDVLDGMAAKCWFVGWC